MNTYFIDCRFSIVFNVFCHKFYSDKRCPLCRSPSDRRSLVHLIFGHELSNTTLVPNVLPAVAQTNHETNPRNHARNNQGNNSNAMRSATRGVTHGVTTSGTMPEAQQHAQRIITSAMTSTHPSNHVSTHVSTCTNSQTHRQTMNQTNASASRIITRRATYNHDRNMHGGGSTHNSAVHDESDAPVGLLVRSGRHAERSRIIKPVHRFGFELKTSAACYKQFTEVSSYDLDVCRKCFTKFSV